MYKGQSQGCLLLIEGSDMVRGRILTMADVMECYLLYVYYHMSLRETAKELCLSHQQVKNRLEALKYFDDEMYQSYKAEREVKKRGPKKKL